VTVAVVGAGAAGLMAAIEAARRGAAVVALEGARTLGAKILVSGGARCNVTHDVVDETAFAGSTRPAIRKVLRRFDVPRTVAFFEELGVTLKREETGKLFPTTDRARTVLDALRRGADEAGVALRHPWRVEAIERAGGAFRLQSTAGETLEAVRVVLATGGKSLPKSGSDGHGYALARSLEHTVTPRVFPALVPLTLPEGHALRALAGLAVPVRLEVRTATGRVLVRFTGPLLCTHFGVSGPVVLDISRYWTDARLDDPGAALVASWLPQVPPKRLDADLRALGGGTVGGLLERSLPERLARTVCALAGVDPGQRGSRLAREERAALVRTLFDMPLPVTGDRGFDQAEVTAGGVPLSELNLDTMESRVCPGLYLCGEICDVDGRIGGYNFQWAWASGHVAGVAAARESD
jgi:predicted Rossmann fold flavoprotein